jgi:predicted regulator of Ras-like GTPase activity (Roadblock/LC7/MglB family)
MYLHRSEPSWSARILGSARTLAAIVVTALLASALTVRWSDALATSATAVTPTIGLAAVELPVNIEGTLIRAGDGLVALVEHGADAAVAFPIREEAQLMRAGEAAPLDALRVGDTVRMTIDGRTGQVLYLQATPPAGPAFHVPGTAAFLAALGLIGGATALAIRNIERLPTLPARLPAARLHPVGASR